MFDFIGKRVLVTGGSGGIGSATVSAFRARGAAVAVGARSASSYEALVARLAGADTHGAGSGNIALRLFPAIGDVRDRAGAHAIVARALDALGGLDVLVNSAGLFAEVAVAQVSEEHWDETLAVNLTGTFFCSQAAVPALSATGGNIVNVASDAGLIGYPLGAAYSAAKGGVVNLTRSMAVELARRIRVNCVCPGNVDTDMILEAANASGDREGYLARAHARAPTKRMATAGEVAAAILYLASTEAASTTGVALPVDGGGTAGF